MFSIAGYHGICVIFFGVGLGIGIGIEWLQLFPIIRPCLTQRRSAYYVILMLFLAMYAQKHHEKIP